MKLNELNALRPTQQIAKVLETQGGRSIDFALIGPRRAQGMLHQVRNLLREHRASPTMHTSERDPAYLQLLMMEQGLAARLSEQTMQPQGTADAAGTAAASDPKSKAVLDKVARGQTLTPDEQKTANKLALMQKESRSRRIMREQSELQQAQVVLAAQDMIDKIQKMMEDISEMQFKDLPALVDTIKNDMGTEQATQFQSAASQALTTLLQAVQSGKTEMESAQGAITGTAPVVPGQEPGMATDMAPAPTGDELDLSLDANLGGDSEEEEEQIDLGRERR